MIASKRYMQLLSEKYDLECEMEPFLKWYKKHSSKVVPKRTLSVRLCDYEPETVLEFYREDCKQVK